MGRGPSKALQAHGTTVLALRFDEGVIVLGDRRATAGNLVMYDQAEKIMAIDDFTLLALSGSFAKSSGIRPIPEAFVQVLPQTDPRPALARRQAPGDLPRDGFEL